MVSLHFLPLVSFHAWLLNAEFKRERAAWSTGLSTWRSTTCAATPESMTTNRKGIRKARYALYGNKFRGVNRTKLIKIGQWKQYMPKERRDGSLNMLSDPMFFKKSLCSQCDFGKIDDRVRIAQAAASIVPPNISTIGTGNRPARGGTDINASTECLSSTHNTERTSKTERSRGHSTRRVEDFWTWVWWYIQVGPNKQA